MLAPGEIRDLLEERPDLEPAVEAVLAAEEPWTFHDVGLDSGVFGELVSTDLVEDADGEGYRLVDAEATRQALRGEAVSADRSGDEPEGPAALSAVFDSLPSPDRLTAAFVSAGLLAVVAFRLVTVPAVFRGNHVVLTGNDPYYYRYFVERLVAADVGVTTLPERFGEPLLVATLSTLVDLLGGGQSVSGYVLAWYPVVFAAVTALLVYVLTVRLTDDRRVALASLATLAVLPSHALRTSLGFADHHAFDYLWVTLTLLSLVFLTRLVADDRRNRRLASLALVLSAVAVGVTGSVLSWEGGPILILPVGMFLAVESLRAVHDGDSPLTVGAPLVVGVVVAALLTWVAHSVLNWQTAFVALAPALVSVGGVGVVAVSELWQRADLPAAGLAVVGVVGFVSSLLTLRAVWPDFWARLVMSVSERLVARRNVAEVQGLFSESAGWLLLFGFLLFVAIPYMAWATVRARRDTRWLPAVIYGWYFLLLAMIQVRFAGQLSLVVAVFAGLGLVHLAERVDVARPPVPFDGGVDGHSLSLPGPRRASVLVALFVLVAGLGIIQIPVKTSQITVSEERFETATWIAEYSDEQGLEYSDNYVFSEWSDNRVYNYFVNGESKTYRFARANYDTFLQSDDPGEWYNRLAGRTGFVVYGDEPYASGTVGAELAAVGRQTATVPSLSHYRAVHVSDGGNYHVFAIVPGAELSGTAEPNTTVSARTTVTMNGNQYTYERRLSPSPNGSYSVTVPYPGEYRVDGAAVRVPESAVENGTVVPV